MSSTKELTALSRGLEGIYAYKAGVSGMVIMPAYSRIISWQAACNDIGAKVVIDNGDNINIPEAGTVNGVPFGTLVAPTFEFITTTSYFIEYLV